jgi:hypothetical protein
MIDQMSGPSIASAGTTMIPETQEAKNHSPVLTDQSASLVLT